MYALERNCNMKLFLGAGSLDVAGTQPELWAGPSALGVPSLDTVSDTTLQFAV